MEIPLFYLRRLVRSPLFTPLIPQGDEHQHDCGETLLPIDQAGLAKGLRTARCMHTISFRTGDDGTRKMGLALFRCPEGVIPKLAALHLIPCIHPLENGDEIARSRLSQDIPAYVAVASGKEADPSSAIVKNLVFFKEKMEADAFDPQTLFKGLRHLLAILVEVDDPEEAQAIFESINSKGMRLNVADMVRNYLLLIESHDEQARLYEQYWKPSQEMFAPDPGSLKLNTGIKSWLSVRLKGARILSADQVYSSFKRYAEDVYEGEKEPLLRELRGFCLMWAENYRYHGVKKFRSGSAWAELGAPTLTAGYPLKKATNEAYAQKLREELCQADSRW